jgi:formate dehydrogenase maturation protein FdhE
VIRLAKAPDAVPDVDEIAALALDVWAQEHGYRKLVRNLIGV